MEIKNTLLYFVLLTLSFGCSKTDIERGIIDNDPQDNFEKLIMLINVKTANDTYIVAGQVDSVEIFMNSTLLGLFNSTSVDVDLIDHTTEGVYEISNNTVNYFVEAAPDYSSVEANTAGDYSQFLNDFYEIKPGDYVCLIKSFQLTDNNGDTNIYHPYMYVNFTVEQSSTSVFIGEITIEI